MSDSDSTWPGTDDFGSRFLEIDEYEQAKESPPQQNTSPPSLPRFRPHRGSRGSQPEVPTRRSNEVRTNRGLRFRSYNAAEESAVACDNSSVKPAAESKTSKRSHQSLAKVGNRLIDADDNDDEMDRELSTFRNPKLMTARQLTLKMQRSAVSGLDGSTDAGGRTRAMATSALLTLESLEPSKPTAKPTPEQLFARQQRIARRRESAKRKAEMEKQLTVERLLKVNVNSVGLSKRGRGRGCVAVERSGFRRPPSSSYLGSTVEPSGMETNEDDADGDDENDDNEASDQSETTESRPVDNVTELDARRTLAEQHGLSDSMMDPPPQYVRWISSVRLTPSSRVCFGSGIVPDLVNTPQPTPHCPEPPRLCELGCGRLRRYTCSTTGRALCSLACYKTNLGHAIPSTTTISGMRQSCVT